MASNGRAPSTVELRRRWLTGPALVIASLFLAVHAFWLVTRPALDAFNVRKLPDASRSDDRHPDAPAVHAGPELASHDGSWLAAVVAMDYRPTDVVVVSR